MIIETEGKVNTTQRQRVDTSEMSHGPIQTHDERPAFFCGCSDAGPCAEHAADGLPTMTFVRESLAKLTEFQVGDLMYLVVQDGDNGIPTFMIFEAEFGMGDNGDAENGPDPYSFVESYEEVQSGVGGRPDAADTLREYLRDQLQAEDERQDEERLSR